MPECGPVTGPNPRAHGVPQVTPCATVDTSPSSQRTQAPGPGFGVESTGELACGLASRVAAARAAEVAVVEMNCRREMRLFI